MCPACRHKECLNLFGERSCLCPKCDEKKFTKWINEIEKKLLKKETT